MNPKPCKGKVSTIPVEMFLMINLKIIKMLTY